MQIGRHASLVQSVASHGGDTGNLVVTMALNEVQNLPGWWT